MQIPLLAALVPDLPKQEGASVAQLRHPDAELVSRVRLRDRLGARQALPAAQVVWQLRVGCLGRVELEKLGRARIERDEKRIRQRRRIHDLVHARVQAGVGILERQGGEPVHVPKIDRWLPASAHGILFFSTVNPSADRPSAGRPAYRLNWALGPGRICVAIEEGESDISVMEVKAR